MLKPTFEVEVAEPAIVRPETVVVPKPELETLSHGAVVEPTQSEKASPATESTESRALGEVVPIPNLPSVVRVVVAVPPNCAKLAESSDDDALVKYCRADQKLVSPRRVDEANVHVDVEKE